MNTTEDLEEYIRLAPLLVEWAGSEEAAIQFIHTQVIPSMGMTIWDAVIQGRVRMVNNWIKHKEMGGYE